MAGQLDQSRRNALSRATVGGSAKEVGDETLPGFAVGGGLRQSSDQHAPHIVFRMRHHDTPALGYGPKVVEADVALEPVASRQVAAGRIEVQVNGGLVLDHELQSHGRSGIYAHRGVGKAAAVMLKILG